MRPFRFLADVSSPTDLATLTATARRAQDLGFSTVVIPDHLLGNLSPIPTMAAVLASTTTVRVAGFVLNNDLRHPAVLAADLATLDVLSGGRVDVAIGAGWNKPEYDAIGLPFDRTPVRQARLAEAITVLKGCFSGQPFSFDGEHYRITDYTAGPVPAGPLPFFIGGGGRRTLTLAAREASIVGLAPRIGSGGTVDPHSLTLAATVEKVGWVRAAAGARFSDLEFNIYPSTWPVTVTDDLHGTARKVVDHLAARTGVTLTEREVIQSPHVFIGSVEHLTEKFLRLREELSISSILLGEVDELTPVLDRLSGQ